MNIHFARGDTVTLASYTQSHTLEDETYAVFGVRCCVHRKAVSHQNQHCIRQVGYDTKQYTSGLCVRTLCSVVQRTEEAKRPKVAFVVLKYGAQKAATALLKARHALPPCTPIQPQCSS